MSIRPATTATVDPPGGDVAPLIAALRHRIDGVVLTPDDAGFADAARTWNRSVVRSPAVIVVAEHVGDVIATVRFAAELGVGLGVRATGQGVAVPVDGVLLVTSRLQEVVVDPEERTAWVGAGCTWGQVVAATQAHGLAPVAPASSVVGAVGSTIGGGLGWLARRAGPSCDFVRSFEVVTPDGSLVRACGCENADLFRALRGGGGGGGVVTDMEIELVALTTVYAGNLYYPPDAAAEVVARYASWVGQAPAELTSSVVLTDAASGPDVPDELRGHPATIVRGCWSGPVADGRALLDGWRAMMPPHADTWSAMPFEDLPAIGEDEADGRVVTGGWLDIVDAEVGAVLAAATFRVPSAPGDAATGGPAGMRFSEIRHVGGAVATGDREHSAMGNRDKPFLLRLVGTPTGPSDGPAIRAHQAATKSALGARLSDRTYLNFLDGDERRRAASTAIDPADRAAIAEMCHRRDPDDVLRFGVDHA